MAPDPAPHDSEREEKRTYTYSITEEDRQISFRTEDERWSRGNQIRDWGILFAMITINLLWMLIVFLLEPGLR